jgi:hypothetical protein
MTENFYYRNAGELNTSYSLFPPGIRSFIDSDEWIKKIMEIKNNTSGLATFNKRFFGWFNMFRIVKYLNRVHTGIFEKVPVDAAASELLEIKGISRKSEHYLDLLLCYRSLEKNI